MPDKPESVDIKVKIDILLKEYDSLRTEILARARSRFAIVGLLGAFIAYLLTQSQGTIGNASFTVRCVMAAVGLCALLSIYWRFGILIRRLARRVRAIEQKVNDLVGEELLVWETRFGWGRIR